MWEAHWFRVVLSKQSRQPVALNGVPGLQVNSLGPVGKKPSVSRKAGTPGVDRENPDCQPLLLES